MLQAYPIRPIEADGHACIFLLGDGVDIFCQQSSNQNLASTTHSDYKKHCTAKFLGCCDATGCTWDGSVSEGNPGKARDVMMTADTNILRQVPFGHT